MDGTDHPLRRVKLRARVDVYLRAQEGVGATTDSCAGLVKARASLRRRLDEWRVDHVTFFPEVYSGKIPEEVVDGLGEDEEPGLAEVADSSEESPTPLADSGPEVETLFMPSDFDKDTLMKTDTALLAFAEYKLREGKAYDYLAALREGLGRKAATIQQKDQHAHGTRNNIAAQAEVQAEVVNVREFARQYNANYGKLVALRLLLQGTDFAVPLTDALRVINMKADLKPSSLQSARTLGDSQNTDSWIFNVAPPQASGSKESEKAWIEESAYHPSHHALPRPNAVCQPTVCAGRDPGRICVAPTRR